MQSFVVKKIEKKGHIEARKMHDQEPVAKLQTEVKVSINIKHICPNNIATREMDNTGNKNICTTAFKEMYVHSLAFCPSKIFSEYS